MSAILPAGNPDLSARYAAVRAQTEALAAPLSAEDCALQSNTFGLSYRELDRGDRQFSFPTTSPSQFDPPALHRSIERMVCLAPEAIYVTHFGRLRDIPRLAADLHRLIDAHADLALKYANSGAQRPVNLTRGVRQLVRAEAARQGWALAEDDALEIFKLDIELNAQGLEAWLDSNTRGKETRFPSENR